MRSLLLALCRRIVRWLEPDGVRALDIDQALTQLAGCLSTAEGWGLAQLPKKGEWSWSPALQAVADLRRDYDYVKKALADRQDQQAAAREALVLQPPAPAVFKTQSGETLESPRTWDKRLERFGGPKSIPYEELEGMFLDQFLLRFFHELMPQAWNVRIPEGSKSPWPAFVWLCPWAKEMPLLFEQMTGYSLNDIQLNNAIAEWARRLQTSQKAAQ